MSQEQRIADLERVVAMLIQSMSQREMQHFVYAEQGGKIRFTFNRLYDGGLDIDFEPAP